MNIVWWTLLSTQLTIFSVTLFLHRSQAHRAVDFHPVLNHLFRGWLWLTTGISTSEWVAIHRKHHAKCETSDDPHSPHAKGILNVFFLGAYLYRKEAKNMETLSKYGKGTPNDWLENNVYRRHTVIGLGFCLALNLALFGVWGLLSWGIQMIWIPLWAAGVINGLGHWWGYRNYESPDKSTNLVPWGLWIGGEELHNNHHGHATSAKFSHRPWEFDIGWMAIRILMVVKLAKVKHVVPSLGWAHGKLECDLHTLEAVIAHRYAVLRQYSRKVMARTKTAAEAAHVEQMRERLEAIWKSSMKTSEELLLELQQWCREARASGIHMLDEFAQLLATMQLKHAKV